MPVAPSSVPQAPIGLSFTAGWGNSGAGSPVTYYKDRGRVFVFGAAARVSGTSMVVGTLPVGYRPSGPINFLILVYAGTGWAEVAADGTITVTAFSGGNAAVLSDLSSVNFRV